MSDITIVWDPTTGHGDWQVSGADLVGGNDLASAVLISIFSDRTAHPNDVIPDGTGDPRGWWGDDAKYPVGSRLWLLARSKQTREVLASAQDYILEALQWLLDDGVAAAVDVGVEWTRPGMLGAQVVVRRHDGSAVTFNFAWAWAQITG
ncbi:MAG: phage GP46 family protein [Betaproteobacteria bacterium]|nr:phage GP46 family protein [Betaproteobacteria bacterium]